MDFVFHFFFFNDPATPEIYSLSLHDALPICEAGRSRDRPLGYNTAPWPRTPNALIRSFTSVPTACRSEEHTSELQSQSNLVCRLLLEKKKKKPLRSP